MNDVAASDVPYSHDEGSYLHHWLTHIATRGRHGVPSPTRQHLQRRGLVRDGALTKAGEHVLRELNDEEPA